MTSLDLKRREGRTKRQLERAQAREARARAQRLWLWRLSIVVLIGFDLGVTVRCLQATNRQLDRQQTGAPITLLPPTPLPLSRTLELD